MIHALQTAILYACVAALILIASVVILAGLGKSAETAKRRLRGSGALAASLALAVACTLFARKGTVTISDPYISDSGSYLTNDVAHISIAKRSPLLPDDTSILVYARQVDSTNVTDWVRISPHLTLADHPYDYALPNATNHDVMVAADFTPAPTVHTNGVWQIKGFTIPGTGKAAFPNTKTIRKETP